jgi:hypothetical protein
MDDIVLSRIAKPGMMFILTFFSVRYLTGNNTTAVALALIPFALGFIAVMTNLGYAFTALSVVTALIVISLPPAKRDQVETFLAATVGQVVDQATGTKEPDTHKVRADAKKSLN